MWIRGLLDGHVHIRTSLASVDKYTRRRLAQDNAAGLYRIPSDPGPALPG